MKIDKLKRGRPRKEDAARNTFRVRLTDDDLGKLTDFANGIGVSRSESIRKLISLAVTFPEAIRSLIKED